MVIVWDAATVDPSNNHLTLSGVTVTSTGAFHDEGIVLSSANQTTGQFYAEFYLQSIGNANGSGVGISPAAWSTGKSVNVSPGTSFNVGDTVGLAVDLDAGKIWFARNGVWLSGDPSLGTSPSISYSPGGTWYIIAEVVTGPTSDFTQIEANFGEQGNSYSIPTGFLRIDGGQWAKAVTVDMTTKKITEAAKTFVTPRNSQRYYSWFKTKSTI